MKQVESEFLLRDCRELLTARMRSSMKKMLSDVEDQLFERATGGTSDGRGGDYIDAVRELRMKKREIQVRFENRLMEKFDQAVLPPQNDFYEQTVHEQPPFEYPVTSTPTPDKLRDECRSALAELDRHVSRFLHTSTGPAFENPLSPGMVFGAFHQCCEDIRVEPDIRQFLLERFDRHVGSVLQGVYEDLSRLFTIYEDGPAPQGAGPGSSLVGVWIREKVLVQIDEMPEFVREFVSGPWAQVLEQIYGTQGEKSIEWIRALQVVDDLKECTVWTGDSEARKKQIWQLRGLVYRLKSGMKAIGLPLKDQAEFLSQLRSHHSRITESSLMASQVTSTFK